MVIIPGFNINVIDNISDTQEFNVTLTGKFYIDGSENPILSEKIKPIFLDKQDATNNNHPLRVQVLLKTELTIPALNIHPVLLLALR